jgi:quinol-cytochrome oxidoreductase complex cytochrome b subunit
MGKKSKIFRNKPFHSIFLLTMFFCITIFLALITTHAFASSQIIDAQSSFLYDRQIPLDEMNTVINFGSEEEKVNTQLNVTQQPPNEDPCLHCHVIGENKGLWVPLGRWVLFGSFGIIFAFGIYRTSNIIVNRKQWKPLLTRVSAWVDERYQIKDPLEKILAKPVPRFALKWYYCLGGITAFLFVVQAITGIMLAFYYKPTPEAAYASIQYIESEVAFGAAFRAIHHWAANGMIVVCMAHMLRVFIMGAYKKPRELNWMSGVVLLLLTLVFGFTGYLLPWDQRAFWASTVGTEIGGAIPIIGNLALIFLRVGWDITGSTLSRFYALHVIAVPILTMSFMVAHFFMIRRQGIMKPL